jgi:hypothetical protein
MKKNYLVYLLIMTVSVTIISTQQAAAQQINLPPNIQKAIRPNQLPAGIAVPAKLAKQGIDLAVTEIRFSIVSLKSVFSGTVKIEAIVKNVGSHNYTSGVNQQTVLLYEEVPGTSPRLVASRNFQSLGVNGTVSVSYSREWQTSDEFPPSYTAIVVYDPDIYLDSNNNNDDGNSSNNRLTRPGSEINKLNWKR